MRKTYDRNRLGYVAAPADARPTTAAYDPYFPVVAPPSSDRASLSTTSAGHTLFDPFQPRRATRMEF